MLPLLGAGMAAISGISNMIGGINKRKQAIKAMNAQKDELRRQALLLQGQQGRDQINFADSAGQQGGEGDTFSRRSALLGQRQAEEQRSITNQIKAIKRGVTNTRRNALLEDIGSVAGSLGGVAGGLSELSTGDAVTPDMARGAALRAGNSMWSMFR